MQTPTLFNGKHIRRIRGPIREQRYFSVVDIVGILSQSVDGRKYRNKLQEIKSGVIGVGEKMSPTKITSNRS